MSSRIRYYDIDWLRVLGMLTIFLFHNARFFNFGDWHVKNSELSFGMAVFVDYLAHFIMPLFFLVSAFAIYYAFRSRSNRQFISERATRLLIPLVVGIFTHVMLQAYIENITHSRFSGSFWEFIPHYFDGWYGFGGNFAWMGLHLWYLLILFLFSVLMIPLFRRLRTAERFTSKIADITTKTFGPYLFIVPLFIMELVVSLSPDALGRRDFGGWSLLTYLVFFIIGYILATDDRYRPAFVKVRHFSLALGLASSIAIYFMLAEMELSGMNPIYLLARSVMSWSFLLAFLGYAGHHLNFNNRFLQYANEAVLPFYILHQSVIVILGYFVMDWNLAVLPKYLFDIAVSFVIIIVIYEFVIRRIKLLRFLFGMR